MSKKIESKGSFRLKVPEEAWKTKTREEISKMLEGKPNPSEVNASEETNATNSPPEDNKGELKGETKKKRNGSFGSASNPYVR